MGLGMKDDVLFQNIPTGATGPRWDINPQFNKSGSLLVARAITISKFFPGQGEIRVNLDESVNRGFDGSTGWVTGGIKASRVLKGPGEDINHAGGYT